MARNSLGGFFVRHEYRQPFQRWFIGLSDISWNMIEWQKELFIKSSIIITTQPLCCGGKDPVLITDDILEVIETWKLLFWVHHVDDFQCCGRTFEELISLIEKKIVIFQSIYQDTYNLIKKGMRMWRMQSSIRDRSCVKCVDCEGLFTWRAEDPSPRKILEGQTNFRLVYMQKFWSGQLLEIK